METVDSYQKKRNSMLCPMLKLFFVGFVSIIILTSCSQYQCVYINSNLPKSESKEFVNETDSFLIKYSFARENFGVEITILNKLEKPVYIDWGRTTLIVNGIQEDGSFYNDQQITSIAPKSYASFSSNTLIAQFIDTAPLDSLGNKDKSKKDKSKIHLYDENNSPVYFRNILSLTTHENLSSPIFFDDSFWVSEIFRTTDSSSQTVNGSANQFYIRKNTGFGMFMGWTAAISGLIVWGLSSEGR